MAVSLSTIPYVFVWRSTTYDIRMAKRELHAKALELRKQGMSYSQIKRQVDVSRGTLSTWLRDHPLSEQRTRELRDNSEVRIERYRNTRRKTKEARLGAVLQKVREDIGNLKDANPILSGFFLYWGEGGKTEPTRISLSNTDPAMLRFFIEWLMALGAERERIKVRLHLYSDMDAEKEINYWSETLDISPTAFRKPYIKKSKRENITYEQKFIHGTCNVIYGNRDIAEYVHMALKYLRSQFAGEPQV